MDDHGCAEHWRVMNDRDERPSLSDTDGSGATDALWTRRMAAWLGDSNYQQDRD
jgi:hypothetical protein